MNEERLEQKEARRKFVAYLNNNISYLKRRNSILTLKNSYIKYKHDSVNILTILVSTGLTCFETIKNQLDMASSSSTLVRQTAALIPILMTSYIAISMSILKFCRFTETMEENTKCSEKVLFTVCRLRRVVEDAHMTTTMDQLDRVRESYSKNPFDLFIDAREALDKTLRFQDVVFFGKQLDNWTEDIDNDVGWWERVVCRCTRRRKMNNKKNTTHETSVPTPSRHTRSISTMEMGNVVGHDNDSVDSKDEEELSPSRESSPVA
jgi:hypothetical protein